MITIDLSDLTDMISADEVEEMIEEELQDTATAIFTDLTAPPPIGTPVDQGTARQGWQLDMSDPMSPEIYNMVVYIAMLAYTDHSKQSPLGWFQSILDKHLN